MTKSLSNSTKTLLVLAVAGLMGAFYAESAAAQAAKKLKCTGCVKSKQIKNLQVKNADLANDSVNGQKIIDGAVGNADLGDDAVTGAKVQNDSLTAIDLLNEAGGDFVDGDQDLTLGINVTLVRGLILTPPTNGVVLVHAAGTLVRDGDDAIARCSISTFRAVDFDRTIYESVSAAAPRSAFGLTRGVEVTGGQTAIFFLACELFQGPSIRLTDGMMTAMFLPTRY